jgi:hypothetical protein
MLIRAENEPVRVVEEAALPTEAELHDALTSHPELIPASDIGLGETVVVGRESGLAAGYADLGARQRSPGPSGRVKTM